jgi:toxin ParE1/3/4
MSAIFIRPQALADLAEIWTYIASDNVSAADALVGLINDKFQALSRQPGMGRARPELAKEIRSLSVGRYVIFYLPLSNGVDIARVLHGARDIETTFQDEARPV